MAWWTLSFWVPWRELFFDVLLFLLGWLTKNKGINYSIFGKMSQKTEMMNHLKPSFFRSGAQDTSWPTKCISLNLPKIYLENGHRTRLCSSFFCFFAANQKKGYESTNLSNFTLRKLRFWPHIYHLLTYTAIWIVTPPYQCPSDAFFGSPFQRRLSPMAGWNSRDPLNASSKASLPKEPAKSDDLAPGWKALRILPWRIGSGQPIESLKMLWSKK